MRINPLLLGDSYKFSHFMQYPKNMTGISSYIESRGGLYDRVLFFGLQMFVKEYMMNPITMEDILEAKEVMSLHGLPFPLDDLIKIVEKYNGYWPVEITAVKEGTLVETHNVLVQIKTVEFPWVVGFIETQLLRAVWYPTTVATQSFEIKKVIKKNLSQTADNLAGLHFKLHDFGCRGVSSLESAGIGGLAHLVNFRGTDTLPALVYAKKFYHCDMAGFSIPATEHSTMTTWGRDGEKQALNSMIDQFGGRGKLFACVGDSYNIWNFVNKIVLDGEIIEKLRNSDSTLVVRPDSGNPVSTPVDVVQLLLNAPDSFKNSKGYHQLPNYLRVIQGDGVNINSISEILNELEKRKISGDNIAFGMGGSLLQNVNRDTQKFAMKASAAQFDTFWIDDTFWVDVYKDPITDKGKTSKKGRLALVQAVQESHSFTTIREDQLEDDKNYLELVYSMNYDKPFFKEFSLEEIREQSEKFI